MQRIAIIGAGLSGLTLAHRLIGQPGFEIEIFEKARGVSGRMSTRYADPYQFDHGATYFTARSSDFKQFLAPFIADGTITDWQAKATTLSHNEKPYKRDWFEPHYVGSPKMNDLCKALAADKTVHIGTEITGMLRQSDGWDLYSADATFGPYDWVISSAPAPQTAKLLPDDCSFQSKVAESKMLGCYSLMLGYNAPSPVNWHAAKVKDSPLGWMVWNESKPGRSHNSSLLIQTDNDWAEAHIDDPREDVQAILLAELAKLVPELPAPDHIALHGWRYADVAQPACEKDAPPYLIDHDLQLGACGDWCKAGRIEAAFSSGKALAEALLV